MVRLKLLLFSIMWCCWLVMQLNTHVIDGRSIRLCCWDQMHVIIVMGVGEIRDFGWLLHVMVLEMKSLFACSCCLVMAWENESMGEQNFCFPFLNEQNEKGLHVMRGVGMLEVSGNMSHWVHEVEACGWKWGVSHSKRERESDTWGRERRWRREDFESFSS
jgi:hypothetical protein